jgi:3-oxoadipate enol-lactonase
VTGLSFRWDGRPDVPVLVLGPSLGTTLHVWDEVIVQLMARWRILRFDLPGHNRSSAPPGSYTMATLADRVLGLLDRHRLQTVAFGGISISGAIGQQLAIDHPSRVNRLILICTAARFADPDHWIARAARVRAEGMHWLADTAAERWLTAAYAATHPAETDRLRGMLADCDPDGYARCCEALAGFDSRHALADIGVPTLVVAGKEDPVTPAARARDLAVGIPGARLHIVSQASHLATVEHPASIARLIGDPT